MPPAPFPAGPGSDTASAWTGTDFVVVTAGKAAAFSPSLNAWRTLANPPGELKVSYSATGWTGRELLVWSGGENNGNPSGKGFAFDPAANGWRQLPGSPLSPRAEAAAAWTGSEFVIVGGFDMGPKPRPLADGAAYDPTHNSWRRIKSPPFAARQGALAVWTGNGLAVWGGEAAKGGGRDGAIYNPARDEWRPLAASPLTTRRHSSAVWTGTNIIEWGGGYGGTCFADGAQYDPTADGWVRLPQAPIDGRLEAAAAWVGDRIVVWGGGCSPGGYAAKGDGAVYRP